MSEAPEPPENVNVLAAPEEPTKKCGRCCKLLGVSAFGTHLVKGQPVVYSKCELCRPKHNATSNSSITPAKRKVYMTKYLGTEKGKATRKQYQQSDAGKVAQVRYQQSDKGKAMRKRVVLKYERSVAGKATRKLYAQSDAGKAAQVRYQQSDKSKASRERHKKLRNARRNARYAMDPAYKLMHKIHAGVAAFLADRNNVAGTFEAHTDLSSSDLHEWVDAQLKAKGLKWSDYAITWEVEHKIPQAMYDFSDPADVKRCWSFRNVHVMSPEENRAKDNKLLDEIVKDVPAEEYPASWNGVYPSTEEAKQAKYAAIKAKKDFYKPKEVYGPYLEKIEKELAEKTAKKAAKAAAAAAASRLSSEADTSSSDSSDASDDESSDSDDESDDQPPAPAPLSKAAGKRKAEPSAPATGYGDSSDDDD
jgi:hypothetical protein